MSVVVDASALVALALNEPERPAFEARLFGEQDIRASSMNLTEAGIILVLREGVFSPADFDDWLATLGVQETPIDGLAVLRAYLTFGRGVHKAGLNIGDCFAYALAKELGAPLLFKGDDFRWTDVTPALQPT